MEVVRNKFRVYGNGGTHESDDEAKGWEKERNQGYTKVWGQIKVSVLDR